MTFLGLFDVEDGSILKILNVSSSDDSKSVNPISPSAQLLIDNSGYLYGAVNFV